MADPEPTSDISNQNVPLVIAGTNTSNGNVKIDADNSRPTAKALQNVQSVTTNGKRNSRTRRNRIWLENDVAPAIFKALIANVSPSILIF